MFSTITTAPSTTMPKSSAPSESRLAGICLQVETGGGKQQREGNGEHDDDCAAHVAEKEKENDRDQDHSLGQVVQHGVRGEVEQVAAIDEGSDASRPWAESDRSVP